MSLATVFERISRQVLMLSLAVMAVSWYFKDKKPDTSFYDGAMLIEPVQEKTSREPFEIEANGERYLIKPLYDYRLNGVIVTWNNADTFGNIWHHRRWKDFINLRDLCVIWNPNVSSEVYKNMSFSSDSWTCWVQWQDRETSEQFKPTALSNNHLLTDDAYIKKKLMQAENYDQIYFKGMLVNYENLGNGFKRGTSTRRDDSGNGACETVYLEDFSIIKKANPQWRILYNISSWTSLIAFISTLLLLFIAPHHKHMRMS